MGNFAKKISSDFHCGAQCNGAVLVYMQALSSDCLGELELAGLTVDCHRGSDGRGLSTYLKIGIDPSRNCPSIVPTAPSPPVTQSATRLHIRSHQNSSSQNVLVQHKKNAFAEVQNLAAGSRKIASAEK